MNLFLFLFITLPAGAAKARHYFTVPQLALLSYFTVNFINNRN